MNDHKDRYHPLRDSLAAKRQRAYFEEQYPGAYAQWLTTPNRKERRKWAAKLRKAVK